ncbi:DUF6118 family protein [Phenylobacterium sp.]|uniref:DUF6118 family protein n=1 Tax=Phenylobacterium sp. TaxID=1871053 RepID=UPI003D2703A2
MSLQPTDPASDVFERLRLEVALLRRAVEGLAAERDQPAPDYSPTLAALKKSLAEVQAALENLGERPALVLGPEHLGPLFHQAAGRLLAKPIAELERDRALLTQAAEALRGAHAAEAAHAASWRRRLRLVGGGAALGALLWVLLSGPVARSLPTGWQVPERLAAATLALPGPAAGQRLLQAHDPLRWQSAELLQSLADDELMELRECVDARNRSVRPVTCTLKLRRR